MLKAKITFLPGNNYPDLHNSQGGMKFATQISPLLVFLSTDHERHILEQHTQTKRQFIYYTCENIKNN